MWQLSIDESKLRETSINFGNGEKVPGGGGWQSKL